MLSFHLSILIFIVFEAAAVPLAIWIRLIYVRSSERKLGAGSSCRVRVADFAGLSMIFVTTCVMAIAACILSTKRQDPAWAVALELSACISLIVAEVSDILSKSFNAPSANISQATYTTLILNFATPYLMFGAFFCVLMNSVLSFLPPALDLAGDMNISKLHVYSLSLDLFLAFIMCVFQALLLLGRALSGHGRASGPQWTKRALILFFVVATAEGIAFLVLAIDNIAYKRIPEEVLPVNHLFCPISLC
jgi:hypothetical protein